MPISLKIALGLAVLIAGVGACVLLLAFLFGGFAAFWILVLGGIAFAVLIMSFPLRFENLHSRANPAQSFQGAKSRFMLIEKREETGVNELCKSFLLDHGEKTEICYVLLHGVSNCPRSMIKIAPLLKDTGANVLVTRMPENGMADRAANSLAHLTADEIRNYADESVDIACGLGEEVVVLGISGGGTAAAWIAQFRSDVARTVLVAPFLGLSTLGSGFNWFLMKLTLILPPISFWKDPIKRANATNVMPHAMLRQSSRGVGELLRLGFAVRETAKIMPFACSSVGVLLNDADTSVSNKVTEDLANEWRQLKTRIDVEHVPKEDNLPHEMIDPATAGANTAKSYPILLSLLEWEQSPPSSDEEDDLLSSLDEEDAGMSEADTDDAILSTSDEVAGVEAVHEELK